MMAVEHLGQKGAERSSFAERHHACPELVNEAVNILFLLSGPLKLESFKG